MKNKIIIIAVVVVLVIGAGAFYGGMRYQQSQTPQRGNFSMGNIPVGQRPGAAGNFRGTSGGLASGEIIAKDDKSITLKLGDGGSKIVFYSASTQLQEMASTTPDSLVIGKQVAASGTANSDGSLVAKSIQLRQDVQPIGK